jgi:hypothetical protein
MSDTMPAFLAELERIPSRTNREGIPKDPEL